MNSLTSKKLLQRATEPCLRCNSKHLGYAYNFDDTKKPIVVKCLDCGFTAPGSDNDFGAVEAWNAYSFGRKEL